jgi:hypothetical protein
VGGGVETAAVSLSPAVASAASSGGRLSVSDVNARSQTCSLKLRRGDERCSSNTSAADGGRLTAFGRTAGDGERPEWWAGGCLSSSSLGASAWGGILGRDSGAKLVAALSTNSCCQPPGPRGGGEMPYLLADATWNDCSVARRYRGSASQKSKSAERSLTTRSRRLGQGHD